MEKPMKFDVIEITFSPSGNRQKAIQVSEVAPDRTRWLIPIWNPANLPAAASRIRHETFQINFQNELLFVDPGQLRGMGLSDGESFAVLGQLDEPICKQIFAATVNLYPFIAELAADGEKLSQIVAH